jgi:hypothetical protein
MRTASVAGSASVAGGAFVVIRLLAVLLLVTGCGGRRPPLPDIAGTLPDVVLRAALAPTDGQEAPLTQPLLLDSISFARLGAAAGREPFTLAELQAQVSRPFRPVDPQDVLLCPSREPCRVVEGGTYVEVWEARQEGRTMELVVTRVANLQDLYVLTHSATHRIRVQQEAGTWRLVSRDRLPD